MRSILCIVTDLSHKVAPSGAHISARIILPAQRLVFRDYVPNGQPRVPVTFEPVVSEGLIRLNVIGIEAGVGKNALVIIQLIARFLVQMRHSFELSVGVAVERMISLL